MNEVIINLDNLTEEEKEQVLMLQEKSNGKKAYKPKYGYEYIYISDDGSSMYKDWESEIVDESRYEIGNCFDSDEEADDKIEYLKV